MTNFGKFLNVAELLEIEISISECDGLTHVFVDIGDCGMIFVFDLVIDRLVRCESI